MQRYVHTAWAFKNSTVFLNFVIHSDCILQNGKACLYSCFEEALGSVDEDLVGCRAKHVISSDPRRKILGFRDRDRGGTLTWRQRQAACTGVQYPGYRRDFDRNRFRYADIPSRFTLGLAGTKDDQRRWTNGAPLFRGYFCLQAVGPQQLTGLRAAGVRSGIARIGSFGCSAGSPRHAAAKESSLQATEP